ncbi:MAG: hypothetical protein OEX12_01175, partial [Gammaproteobacteria bacterium]|nr:hypothetical protein [Gammaproteobacteria bacterium]
LYASVIIRPELGVLASNETQQINRVALVSDIALSETIGYAGADTVIVATTNAVTLGIANVLLSINGGGLFEAFTNDPFAADEDIGPVAAAFVTADEIRTIVGRDTTDGAAKAEIAYAQATVPTLSAATWTTVDITQSVNGDTVQALGWITPTMLLAGVAGDIYLSTDFGESFPDAAVFAGTDAINRIIAGANKRIWVVGENGLILLAKNNSTTFEVKSAPTAGSVQCITEAENGAVYAGIGAIIYRSTDQASSVAGWEALRDFGTNKVVKQVALGAVRNGGDAQVIRVVIDDTAAGTGAVYISIDGGTTFEQVPTQVNTGYNDAAFSSTDDNKGFLVGDISAGAGVIHKYQPSTL